ncbi:Long chain base biosynthesis protein 2a [Sesamum angolense]|uniref:serine C-palmitoyltransferase n=1 Tax=Sesamum angolense TaxID=2727404 RepID=A0AAE1WLM2_9LAMI|nr:Long chain base biosynthesis protein 2a [Sesamum angolense]
MITIPYLTALTTYFSYGLLFAFGQLRDFFRKIFDWWSHNSLEGYAPICLGLEDFYIRRLYLRIQDCFNRPICSSPDAWFDVVERISNDYNKTLKRTTRVARCLNLGSYNYLGFAAADEYCTPRAIESLKKFSASTCSTRVDGAPSHLEKVLREQIAEGQPRTHRPWKKIIVVVEGIYSMEGELCQLPEIVSICKKYRAYIYLDEAHSIGAVGKSGRGVCDLLGVDTADIDIMMGTFTKSFGSCGGYIAGSKELIEYLKHNCPAHLYATSISPPAAQQIISSIKVILGEDGSSRGAQKLARIRENSNFFRSELQKMGFEVLGDNDSPVMPIMLYNPAKIPAFSRECLKRNVAVDGGFSSHPFTVSRARICISAAHTREDLIRALEVISRVGDMVGVKYFPAEPKKQQLEEKELRWTEEISFQEIPRSPRSSFRMVIISGLNTVGTCMDLDATKTRLLCCSYSLVQAGFSRLKSSSVIHKLQAALTQFHSF